MGQNKKNSQKSQGYQKKSTKKNIEKDNSMKYLCLFIVVIAFSFAFALLIDKKQNGSYLNELSENGFDVVPVDGKVIVARDMNAIYPKYYVVYTENESYSVYVYNYYDTISQYELEYNRLINNIVDYNVKDKMIRYLQDRGYGTYDEILNNLSLIVGCDNLRIY